MTIQFFLFLAFTNILIATAIAFCFTFLLHKQTTGGFWIALIIALIGAFCGTLLGIYLESRRIINDILIFRFVIPASVSFIILFVFLGISSWHSDE